MRRLFTILASIVVTVSLWAQSPEKMSYQAVIRNSGDSLVRNTQIGMQISILQGAVNGTAVYVETQSPTSNANGLVSVEIGTGITSDDFASIDWANGPYFIKTEIDPTGGSNYTIIGTSQLLSVPYALHAKTADVLTGGITETDPAYTASQAAKITSTDITNLGNLSGVNTGDQDLSGLATKTEVTAGLATKVDKEAGKGLSTNDYTSAEKTKLAAISGTNTGDQDLSALATKTEVATDLATKVDVEAGKGLSTNDYTSAEKTKLAAISGTNTGDQDLTGLATKAALADSTAKVRSEIPDVSGFLSAETDPAYTASQAAKITSTDITNLGNLSGVNTGDQDLSGLATKTEVTAGLATKVDKEAGKGLSTNDYTSAEKTKLAAISGTNTGDQDLSALATKTEVATDLATKVDVEAGKGLSTNDYTSAEKTKLAAISGTNTGDQDLTGLATKTALADSTAKVRSEIPDVSGFLSAETDPAYTASQAAKITATDITNLGNLSGVNTGDQDLTGLATKTEVTAGLATKVDVEAGKGLSTNDYTSAEKTKLAAISGTNTGDQDLSGLATKTEVTAGLATKVDKEAGKGLSTNDYTSAEKTKLAAISGTNTGDQDLSALATKTALADSTAKVRSEIPQKGTQPGEMLYWNGSAWVTVASATSNGQILYFINNKPQWAPMLGENDVLSATGRIWMDRNLGASQVATSSTDEAAYGDLYQWGRAADGHESRTSSTSTTLATSDTPGHGDFITSNSTPYDWRSPQNFDLWQGVSGTNNPCPSGYRIPTEAEWVAEAATWSSPDAAGAFASPLKLPMAGCRPSSSASLSNVGSQGSYWSSTVNGSYARYLYFYSLSHSMIIGGGANGMSVRCIKE